MGQWRGLLCFDPLLFPTSFRLLQDWSCQQETELRGCIQDWGVSHFWPLFLLLLLTFSYRRYAGIPDFLTADDMEGMVSDNRLDPKMIFSYVQEVYRMCNEM